MLEKLQERAWLGLVDTFWTELKSKETFGILVDGEQMKWLVQAKDDRLLLWTHDNRYYPPGLVEENQAFCSELRWLGLKGWRVPTRNEMLLFAKNRKNPLRQGDKNRLRDKYAFNVVEGFIDLDGNNPPANPGHQFPSIPCASVTKQVFADILIDMPVRLSSLSEPGRNWLDGWEDHLNTTLVELDYQVNRLPKIDPLTFTDINKGMWEMWGQDANALEALNIRPRDPARDIRPGCVAIDFGTSSTVVAYETENGRKELMRIGVRDFYERIEPHHFENPTVLEIIDLQALLSEWTDEAYRPGVRWEMVHCSHEAQAKLRDNQSDIYTVSSILTRLKQWALRQSSDHQVVFTDQQQCEHTLAPLTQNNPTRGEWLDVSGDYPFDPIELYAWFLGMTINWRGRGISLEYFMTFPVEYPREVKEKILASFKRGLQRSLPPTLVAQPEFLNAFSVEELASEPAAYAVCALDALAIQPGEQGAAYAVFDFGGGTTDFDFGYYRHPSEDEEDEGFERVFEHFAPAGDKFLGGENLLENMAYRVFRNNLDLCQKYQIAFTRPLDADPFPGSEIYLEKTQAAYSNTMLLISELRPFWETPCTAEPDIEDKTCTVDLFNRAGEKVSCDFVIPYGELAEYLEQRIALGIDKFIAALGQAFIPLPEQIHILLAGNSSRSLWISRLWGLADEGENALIFTRMADRFGNDTPTLHIHAPLSSNPDAPYQPTAKTGVALGLLDLRPGGVTKVINHTRQQSMGEAGFAFNVGRARAGSFLVGLAMNSRYEEWFELGPQREGIFELLYTQSPLAQQGTLSSVDSEVKRMRLRLAVNQKGHRVFAKATAPHQISLVTAANADELAENRTDNHQVLELK
ncbi:hypothetical protein [Atlantibacter sp.]|uniref:hypothetical protein n=1 Tax=Atlantibacter sp. TaxID=1903473 RepID=UPI0028AFB805|nr:hypothetical protein [Atlantibacter sp.]